jgi:hypothetical protein
MPGRGGSSLAGDWSEFDRGGHLPALEAPDLLVGDLRAFFRPSVETRHPSAPPDNQGYAPSGGEEGW